MLRVMVMVKVVNIFKTIVPQPAEGHVKPIRNTRNGRITHSLQTCVLVKPSISKPFLYKNMVVTVFLLVARASAEA